MASRIRNREPKGSLAVKRTHQGESTEFWGLAGKAGIPQCVRSRREHGNLHGLWFFPSCPGLAVMWHIPFSF